jgi:4-amino-4-deoxy-L-arabinose transferase-like glycosyltransferase
MTNSLKRNLVWLALGLLIVSAFFIRFKNVSKSENYAIDELVYAKMANQINHEGLKGYNSIPYGKELTAMGYDLPEYFFQPLFKYPPLFTLLCSLSMKIFGPTMEACALFPLLFGVLLIPTVYALASLIFNRQVALLAAIFMWLDPITIVTSQKVFLDTTLAFFTVLSIYLYIYGILKNRNIFFLLGGVFCGLAVLTKYPGILPVFAVLIYVALKKRNLLFNRTFLLSLTIPFFSLLPWFYWNFAVYGSGMYERIISVNNLHFHNKRTKILILVFLGFIITAFVNFLLNKRNRDLKSKAKMKPEVKAESQIAKKYRKLGVTGVGFALVLICLPFISAGLKFGHIPAHGWQQGLFYWARSVFYFQKLMEYSFIFTIAFAAFFINTDRNTDKKIMIIIPTVVLFFFYMVWGSYQSRYILAAIPFLIILGVQLWMELYEAGSEAKNPWIRSFLRISLPLLLIYIATKTYYLNIVFSYPGDMCYY